MRSKGDDTLSDVANDSLQVVSAWDAGPAYDQAVTAVTTTLHQQALLPFTGAGISCDAPASLPLAAPLVGELLTPLSDALAIVADAMGATPEDVQPIREGLHRARLERLMEALMWSYGRNAIGFLDVLNGTPWNANHAFLAAAGKHGMLPACVTLNFDLLIEHATAALGSCTTVCPLLGRRFSTGSGASLLTVIKPHGSFAPASVSQDRYELLAASISEVGTRPSRHNVRVLREALFRSPHLLIAGYSDDDWDIFPILQHLTPLCRHITWLEYARDADNAAEKIRAIRTTVPGPASAFVARVVPWLRTASCPTTLVLVPATQFLTTVGQRLGLELPTSPQPAQQPQSPDAKRFAMRSAAEDEQSARTLLALATLIQHTGAFSKRMLAWIGDRPVVRQAPDLKWRVEFLQAHTEHTNGELPAATRHMSAAIRLKRRVAQPTADDMIWLGYEHLCLAKRPHAHPPATDPSAWRWLLSVPVEVLRGCLLMGLGAVAKPSHHRQRRQRGAMVAYYVGDLWHSWGNVLMLRGAPVVKRLRLWFAVPLVWYRIAAWLDADLMDSGYYWMRWLEASLLKRWGLGRMNRADVEQRLEAIAHEHRLIQNNVQEGNTWAYRALIAYVVDGDVGAAHALLRKAETTWDRTGGVMAAGHRRVTLFRRFMAMPPPTARS